MECAVRELGTLRRRAATALLVAGLVLSGCAKAETSDKGELSGTELTTPWVASDVALTDTSGAAYSLAADATKPLTLVFFGYSMCPDICQMVMGNITSALTRIGDDVADVDVVFVTTDPARDTEKALRRYLDRFDPSFVGLTGDLDDLSDAASSFHVAFEVEDKLPSGGYDVTHGTQVFALSPDGNIDHYWPQDVTPQQLAQDISLWLEDA
ncbi:SCO family protein [Nocardioides alcanivorans]|uniref:SCO family protein n=1 Tax=Nocardioides alcanivorans TaxID=2897352 RepID=UPI001F1A9225|nr:SCO family protein [Nocardioides alcanivorans]